MGEREKGRNGVKGDPPDMNQDKTPDVQADRRFLIKNKYDFGYEKTF